MYLSILSRLTKKSFLTFFYSGTYLSKMSNIQFSEGQKYLFSHPLLKWCLSEAQHHISSFYLFVASLCGRTQCVPTVPYTLQPVNCQFTTIFSCFRSKAELMSIT